MATKKKPTKKLTTKKKLTKKTKRVNWRKAAIELASCVIFALKFDKHLGRGTGIVMNLKTMEPQGPWQEKFFDALELIGVSYDRKKYYSMKEHKRRA